MHLGVAPTAPRAKMRSESSCHGKNDKNQVHRAESGKADAAGPGAAQSVSAVGKTSGAAVDCCRKGAAEWTGGSAGFLGG